MKEETKKKISKGIKKAIKEKRFFTKEHRRKISESKKGANNPWFGKHLPIEARKKMSEVRKGRPPWNKGKKWPEKSGKNAPGWKGGVSTENELVRHSIESRLWREAVFARDNWTCQKCEVKGGTLHPHHIKNFSSWIELRFAIDNGITLCKKSHKQFHKKYGQRNNTREQLEEFLRKEENG